MGLGIAIAVNGSPTAELAEATTVEVHERMGETTIYRIRYNVAISEGDLTLLAGSHLDAGSELSILVPVESTTHCLVRGPVHGHHIHLEHGGGGSWLEVEGSDASIEMDRETRTAAWSDVTDSDVVQSILSRYGFSPDVEPTSAGHMENKHALVQRDSDLRFVRRMARRNGFLFWVTSDDAGVTTAHFKRPQLDGGADAELVINLDDSSLGSVDIDWDVEQPTSVVGLQLELNNKTDLDGSVDGTPQTLLGDRGLKDITGDRRSVHLAAPSDDAGDIQARGEGTLIEADWFIRATCETNLEAVGAPIRACALVELRGAGSRHSGLYFVSGVRHVIDASAHRMEIELVRNGWGA